MWVVELEGQDRYGRNLPRRVGPFDTQEEAMGFTAVIMPNGSADFARLTSPALALSLAGQPPRAAGSAVRDMSMLEPGAVVVGFHPVYSRGGRASIAGIRRKRADGELFWEVTGEEGLRTTAEFLAMFRNGEARAVYEPSSPRPEEEK